CRGRDWSLLRVARHSSDPGKTLSSCGNIRWIDRVPACCVSTGDQQAKMVGNHQPITLAVMEGKFEGGKMASVGLIGKPNVEAQRLDNPIEVPGALSFLAYGHFGSFVHGLNDFPKDQWPDNLELLYYSFHIMITLGTLFIGLMGLATLLNWWEKLES